eukprot:558392-Rhodomonas_salina.1
MRRNVACLVQLLRILAGLATHTAPLARSACLHIAPAPSHCEIKDKQALYWYKVYCRGRCLYLISQLCMHALCTHAMHTCKQHSESCCRPDEPCACWRRGVRGRRRGRNRESAGG